MPMMEPEVLYEQPMPAEMETVETQAVVETPEKTIEEQITDLKEIIDFLETLWLTDEQVQQEIQPADWQVYRRAGYGKGKSNGTMEHIETAMPERFAKVTVFPKTGISIMP